MLGFQQAWTNFELAYSLRCSLKLAMDQDYTYSVNFIRKGRLLVLLFTTLFVLTSTVVFFTIQFTRDLNGREKFVISGLEYYVPTLQVIDFTLLTATGITIF